MREIGTATDVSRLIDEQGINRFNLRLTAIAFLVVLVEGFDVSALAFALPGLIKTWNITNSAVLGPLLSAALIGMMIGAPLFGYLGDRFGRRWLTILSCLLFGVFTLAVCFATSVEQIFFLRVVAGIGLGGATPNAIALVSEYAPSRHRGTMVSTMFLGIGIGGALPGVLSSLLVAHYGWQSIFVTGGVLSIAVGIICVVGLPESVKYLVVRSRRKDAIGILRVLDPERDYGPNQELLIVGETKRSKSALSELFKNGYAPLTLLLWTVFFCNFMAYFFLLSWTPALLVREHFAPEQAALAQSIFQLGGVAGGLVIGRQIDQHGPKALAFLFVLAIPATAAIGWAYLLPSAFLFLIEFAAGFCILGVAYGLAAFSAILYPTAFRSNGSGWAFGIGRVGSIIGPMLGGTLITAGMDIGMLFLLATIPLVVGVVACFGLARLYGRSSDIVAQPQPILEPCLSNG